MINELCNSYLFDNSNQCFQNNQNLNSLQNSNDFEYNPCQFNFEHQNEFQNENVIHFSNNFGNGNNLDYDTSENFCSQQIQIENPQANNYKLDFC